MHLFNYQNIDSAKINTIKKELNISEEQFILSYIGSIGTWYMLPEMLRFFSMLKQNKPNSIFLFVTKDNPDFIYDEAERQSLNKDDIIVVPSERNDIPNYINISHASIFFIKPCFSKKASSPTKQGELMSMGIPVICNSGIGDTDLIINETDSGILVHSFSDEEYKKAIDKIDDALKIPKVQSRKVAFKYYDLKIAANTYLEIYNRASKT